MAPFYRHHGGMETTTQHRLVGEMVWCRAVGTQLPWATAVPVAQGTNTQPSQVTDITEACRYLIECIEEAIKRH